MFRFHDVIASLLLLALLSGCSSFIQSPRIEIKGTNLVALDSSGIDVEFLLGITNPNIFELSLLGYTYDLRIITLPLLTGNTLMTVNFPAGKETEMRVPVHLNFTDLRDIIKQHPDLNKLPYHINASLHMNSLLGEINIPVDKSDTLSIPERYRPDAAINQLRNLLRGLP